MRDYPSSSRTDVLIRNDSSDGVSFQSISGRRGDEGYEYEGDNAIPKDCCPATPNFVMRSCLYARDKVAKLLAGRSRIRSEIWG